MYPSSIMSFLLPHSCHWFHAHIVLFILGFLMVGTVGISTMWFLFGLGRSFLSNYLRLFKVPVLVPFLCAVRYYWVYTWLNTIDVFRSWLRILLWWEQLFYGLWFAPPIKKKKLAQVQTGCFCPPSLLYIVLDEREAQIHFQLLSSSTYLGVCRNPCSPLWG